MRQSVCDPKSIGINNLHEKEEGSVFLINPLNEGLHSSRTSSLMGENRNDRWLFFGFKLDSNCMHARLYLVSVIAKRNKWLKGMALFVSDTFFMCSCFFPIAYIVLGRKLIFVFQSWLSFFCSWRSINLLFIAYQSL